ncbi:MAG: hypothetical protein M3Y44_06065 [Actinomycetota bacterium]|nr:hypothetical protein [Actinomycetota bacterium]
MTTLRIEHPIHDYDIWRQAFDRFASARAHAGVRGHAIRLPADDPHFLTLDLEFDDASGAQAFATFLQTNVWSSPEASPGLAGTPRTRILEPKPN